MDGSAADEPRRLVFELDQPIRWGDMDAMGHVNNTVYFRYMEQARIAWLEAVGARDADRAAGPLLVDTRCAFRRELRYPGTVRVRQYLIGFGRSSIRTELDIVRADEPDVVYATGEATLAWVDFTTRRSAPVPPAVRDAMRIRR